MSAPRLARPARASISCVAAAMLWLANANGGEPPNASLENGRRLLSSAPEVVLGDRLFFETRFAQFFFAHCEGDVNAPLQSGDPIVFNVERPGLEDLIGPFRGQSISCRHCHLGDDFAPRLPLAQRTYVDFSARSRVPDRGDGLVRTTRNTPLMVDLGLPRTKPMLLHFDAEFIHPADLIIDTLTGRNMGWRIGEQQVAAAHIARVIQEDRGVNPRQLIKADGSGLSYKAVMRGTDAAVPQRFTIPVEYRIDVEIATDAEILAAVAKLIHAYMDSIRFGTEDTSREAGAPYDLFLKMNGLPAEPTKGESNRAYARRLSTMIGNKRTFAWVESSATNRFLSHSQTYVFGQTELSGLRIFLNESLSSRETHAGMCVVCHTPPHFTDHGLHNTGVSQAEYDALFGPGTFEALRIPELFGRRAQPDNYLPSSTLHPHAIDRFRSAPSPTRPGFADLGVWNIFANEDFPKPQAALMKILCPVARLGSTSCTQEALLPLTIALFKTPSIRDLGHSQPYFHSGHARTVEDVLRHYVSSSALARKGRLRNAAPELRQMNIDSADVDELAAFLRSLNEDYH